LIEGIIILPIPRDHTEYTSGNGHTTAFKIVGWEKGAEGDVTQEQMPIERMKRNYKREQVYKKFLYNSNRTPTGEEKGGTI
jgi:hypothetical protein